MDVLCVKGGKMDTQNLRELIETIDESLAAFRYISLQLKLRKAMLPTLIAQIDANEKKSDQAIEALAQLKEELGL